MQSKTGGWLGAVLIAAVSIASCGDEDAPPAASPPGDQPGETTPSPSPVEVPVPSPSPVIVPTPSPTPSASPVILPQEPDNWDRISREESLDMVVVGGCENPRKMTIQDTGAFQIGPCRSGEPVFVGTLTRSEFNQLNGLINAVLDEGIQGEPTCFDVGTFVGSLTRVTLEDGAEFDLFSATPQQICHRDGFEEVQALNSYLSVLIERYYPNPQPGQTPTATPTITPTVTTTVSPSPSPSGIICTAEYVYGVRATVTDANGQPINDATLVLTEGLYEEEMQRLEPEEGVYVGAGERPGNYDLAALAPGKEPKLVEDIEVKEGVCHVEQQKVTIVLQDAGPTPLSSSPQP